MRIGVTGGVGSGKSTALSIIASHLEVCLLKADDIAKELMEDKSLLRELSEAFHQDITDREGKLDKELYGELIFSDKKNAELSDSIVHPRVWRRIDELAGKAEAEDRLVLIETALPSESFRRLCDFIIVLESPSGEREERLSKERGYTKERFLDIQETQLSREGFRAYGDYVILNDGSLEELEQRILKCVDDICKSCKRKQR